MAGKLHKDLSRILGPTELAVEESIPIPPPIRPPLLPNVFNEVEEEDEVDESAAFCGSREALLLVLILEPKDQKPGVRSRFSPIGVSAGFHPLARVPPYPLRP